MAQPFVFTVGVLGDGIDLSNYLRVAPGEGLDPFSDPIEPVYTDSPFSDTGQSLLAAIAHNREGTWPLRLSAVDKDTLHALVRSIQTQLTTPETLLQWRDQGATSTDYWRIVHGRFVPEFNYRRAGRNFLEGRLVLNVQPFATTATDVLQASRLGSGISVRSAAAITVGGDVPAQPIAQIIVGDTDISAVHFGFSVLPTTSYLHQFLPASFGATALVAGGATMIGASGTPASQAQRIFLNNGGAGFAQIFFSPAVIPGRHRLLAYARATKATFRFNQGAVVLGADGPTSVATNSEWVTYDMGVVTIPSYPIASSFKASLEIAQASIAASGIFDVAALLLVPDDSTSFIRRAQQQFASGAVTFDGVKDVAWSVNPQFTDWPGAEDTQRIGLIPRIPPVNGGVVMFWGPNEIGGDAINPPVTMSVKVRDRFTFSR